MVTANNYMFRPVTGHHQVVLPMKSVGGCTLSYTLYVYIVQPPTLFSACTSRGLRVTVVSVKKSITYSECVSVVY